MRGEIDRESGGSVPVAERVRSSFEPYIGPWRLVLALHLHSFDASSMVGSKPSLKGGANLISAQSTSDGG